MFVTMKEMLVELRLIVDLLTQIKCELIAARRHRNDV